MAKFIEKAVRKVRSSSPKRKTISTQHLDHEVFNNNTKVSKTSKFSIVSPRWVSNHVFQEIRNSKTFFFLKVNGP